MKWLAQTFLQREPIYSTVCLMTRLPLKKMEVCQAALRRRVWDTLQYTEPFPRGDPSNVFPPCVKKYRTPITSDKQSKQRTGISLQAKKKNSGDENAERGGRGKEGRIRWKKKTGGKQISWVTWKHNLLFNKLRGQAVLLALVK